MWRLLFTVEVGEHNFMGEERGPFEGGGAISVGAAQKFVLAIGEFDEFCLTKSLNDFGLIA